MKMSISRILYSNLFEEETTRGWDKQTIRYINNNRQRVNRTIRLIGRSTTRVELNKWDVEDILSEIYLYFYLYMDYDELISMERSVTGDVIPLESYVNYIIRVIIIRFVRQKHKVTGKIENIAVEDVEEDYETKHNTNFIHIISDKISYVEYDKIFYNIDMICKEIEHLRYKFSIDIYQMYYVKLLATKHKSSDIYNIIMMMSGMMPTELRRIESTIAKSDTGITFEKAISYCGIDRSIEAIEKYVYSAKLIRDTIQNIH